MIPIVITIINYVFTVFGVFGIVKTFSENNFFWLFTLLPLFVMTVLVAPYRLWKMQKERADNLEYKAQPVLNIERHVREDYGGIGQGLGLRIHNGGTKQAEDCSGVIIDLDFATPQRDVTLSRIPRQRLQWAEELTGTTSSRGYLIPGDGQATLVVAIADQIAMGIRRLYLAYGGGKECIPANTIHFNFGDTLLIIGITSKDAKPFYAVCLLHKDSTGLAHSIELLGKNVPQCPTMDDCRQMLSSHKEGALT